MNHHRRLRLYVAVYQPRRHSLASEYKTYVRQWSSDTPTLDLPHAIDLACFPPFRNIIEAPEEAQTDEKPFAQLPVLVKGWRKQLAELVMILPGSSLEDACRELGVVSNSTTRAEVPLTGSDKLRLACVFFAAAAGVFTHSDVFLTSMLHYLEPIGNASKRTGSIEGRFGILSLKEVPNIVHADWVQMWPWWTIWTARMLD